MANILTGIRLLCGLLILVFPAYSGWFYALYLVGGLTDAVDGTVARKLGKASVFGEKFDTAADFVFAISVAVKLITTVSLPLWLLIWLSIIVAIKSAGAVVGYLKFCRLKTVHSALNKVCGAVVFIMPLIIVCDCPRQVKSAVIIPVCILASAAAVIELFTIMKSRD